MERWVMKRVVVGQTDGEVVGVYEGAGAEDRARSDSASETSRAARADENCYYVAEPAPRRALAS